MRGATSSQGGAELGAARAAAIPRKTITAGTVRENGSWEEASALTHGGQRPWRLRRGALDLPLTATRVPSPGPCTPGASPPMCLRAAMKRRRASAPHRAEPIKCHTVPCAEELSPRNGSRGWLDNDGGRRRQRPPVARGGLGGAAQRTRRGPAQCVRDATTHGTHCSPREHAERPACMRAALRLHHVDLQSSVPCPVFLETFWKLCDCSLTENTSL